jgi:hypothetical protein
MRIWFLGFQFQEELRKSTGFKEFVGKTFKLEASKRHAKH